MVDFSKAPWPDITIVEGGCWVMGKDMIYYKGVYIFPDYYMWLRKYDPSTLKGHVLKRICATDGCVNPKHQVLEKGEEQYYVLLKDVRRKAKQLQSEYEEKFLKAVKNGAIFTEW